MGVSLPSSSPIMDWMCTPLPELYDEALTHNGTVFRDRDYKEGIKVKWNNRIKNPWNSIRGPNPTKKGILLPCSKCIVYRKVQVKTQPEGSQSQTRREVSPANNPASILILYSQPPKLSENTFLVLKPFKSVVFCSSSLWWLILSVTLTGPGGAQIPDQTLLSWVFSEGEIIA